MAELPACSVHAIVTDPPYGLEFMGKEWDRFVPAPRRVAGTGGSEAPFAAHAVALTPKRGRAFQDWCETWAAECLRVLKPGGHLLAFGGTRTWHRLAVAIEDAGFEIRDSIAWMYGSGFPKSLDVSKAIDKAAGVEREVVGTRTSAYGTDTATGGPATPEAEKWDGWGTALKPAFEPIIVARKPLSSKTVAANVLAHGTGAINIDGARVGASGGGTVCGHRDAAGRCLGHANAGRSTSGETIHGPESAPGGRWPANVILDEEAGLLLDKQTGILTSGNAVVGTGAGARKGQTYSGPSTGLIASVYADSGGASRFFYCAKVSKSERNAGLTNINIHPTVKPIALMRYLTKLVTPPGGIVLDPFMGSGSTGVACVKEKFSFIGIEKEKEYLEIAKARIRHSMKGRL